MPDEKKTASPRVRRHYLFRGWVQGVGFRYRACHLAELFRLVGWVQNLPDGDVEAEIEGDPKAIDEMIIRLQASPWIRMEEIRVSQLPVREEERSFRIVH